MSPRIETYAAIDAERARQAQKFPGEETALDLFKGLIVLGEEKGEADRAALELYEAVLIGRYVPNIHDHALRQELLHVAATAVKLIELLGRGGLQVEGGDCLAEPPTPTTTTDLYWCGLCNAVMQQDAEGNTVCPHCGSRPDAAPQPLNPS